jgi:hypothetical protein
LITKSWGEPSRIAEALAMEPAPLPDAEDDVVDAPPDWAPVPVDAPSSTDVDSHAANRNIAAMTKPKFLNRIFLSP